MAKTLDERDLNGVNGGAGESEGSKLAVCSKCGMIKKFILEAGYTNLYKCEQCHSPKTF